MVLMIRLLLLSLFLVGCGGGSGGSSGSNSIIEDPVIEKVVREGE